jgi:hypothetical protein
MRSSLCLVLLFAFACDRDSRPGLPVKQEITGTRVGDTCGSWQVEPANSPVRTRVKATCGPGLKCRIRTSRTPRDELMREFGQCIPAGTTDSCDVLAQPSECPMGLACGYPPGECHVTCREDADCVGTFQFCSAFECKFLSCPLPAEVTYMVDRPDGFCPDGTTCDRGLCVPK